MNIPGLEGINIDEILGRAPKKKTVNRKAKAPPKQKKKITAKPRRISTPMGEINIPGMGGITPRPRPTPKPPVNKVRPKPKPKPRPKPVVVSKPKPKPKPKPVVAAQPSPKELPPVFKGAGRGNAPRVINIPGLGPIEMPMPETPGSEPWGSEPWEVKLPEQIEDFYDVESLFDEGNIIHENPIIGERPDGSPVLLYDDDSGDYLDYEEDKPDPSQPVETQPVETQPVETQPVETQPVETQPIEAPPPPDPFKDYVPRNILGASFDPKDVSAQKKMVAEARARQTPGANIQGGGYLTYDNPLLGNKQTQFGGYGQPMSAKPLMNYAGLASPVRYSSPVPDPDAQPGGPPQPPSFDV